MEKEKKIVLTDKKLDFLLGNKRVLNRTKPVLTPLAQYTTLCGPGSGSSQDTDRILTTLAGIKNKNPILHAVGWLLFTYGLRVSEVLGIRSEHLRNGEKIWIGGKKRSGDRYINYSEIRSIIRSRSMIKGYIFEGYNRFWVYRELKKLGVVVSIEGNKKKAVTHAGRHLNAQELKRAGDSITAIQSFYQHKSQKSTEYYANKKK